MGYYNYDELKRAGYIEKITNKAKPCEKRHWKKLKRELKESIKEERAHRKGD